MSNLDAKLRGHMRVELIQLHRRLSKTAVYVTHDQLEAMTMSDRIAVLNLGRLQQVATPDEIYNRPANRFVATFIGSPEMNFIEGEIGVDANGMRFSAASFDIPLSGDQAVSARGCGAGRAVSAGLRPEDVMLGEGTFEGDITVIEPIGHEILVQLEVRGHPIVARVPAHLPIRSGSRVPIGFRGAKLHLFDAETGIRLT
jgi:multiple sugar transport system ATP-binding protein